MPEIAVKRSQEADCQCVSVDYYFSHLLPKVHERIETTVEAVIEELKSAGHLVDEAGKLTWASFEATKESGQATSSVHKASTRGSGGKREECVPRSKTSKKKGKKKLKEDKHFRPFVAIFNQVVESAERVSGVEDLEKTHSYRMEPHATPTSDTAERMRPDACFVRGPPNSDEGERTSWYEVACVGEFKTAKKKKDENDVS